MSNEFDFSQDDFKPIPVTGPNGTKYLLKKASAGAAKAYRMAAMSGTEMEVDDANDKRIIKKMAGMSGVECLLVARCLWTVDGNQNPSTTDIEGWPADAVKKLFNKARDVSDLEEKEDLKGLRRQQDKLTKRIAKAEAEEVESASKKGQDSSTLSSE